MNSGLQQAELHLNPADLGPIHIHLSVSAQTADLSFSVAHSATREGITQSLPALREMLASQGMSLGQAAVGQGQDGRQPPQPGQQAQPGTTHPGDSAGTPTGAMLNGGVAIRIPRGMLDLYA